MKEKTSMKDLPTGMTPQSNFNKNDFFVLRESFNLFTAIENLGYFCITRGGKIIEMNTTMIRILGLDSLKIPPSHISIRLKNLLIGKLKPYASVNSCKKDLSLSPGNSIQVLLSVKSVFFNDNEIIIGFAEDITSNKVIKENLEINQANLDILIESIDNPAWSVDSKGRLMGFNRVFKDYFIKRFKNNPEIGTSIFKSKSYKDVIEWKKLFDRAMQGEKQTASTKVEINNTIYNYEVLANPILDKSFKIVGVAFISHDITERKSTEKLLFKSKTHLHALINNIPYLIWLKDAKGKFVITNQHFLNFFKIKDSSLNKPGSISQEYKGFWHFISDDSDILATGSKLMEEKSYKIKNEIRWFEIHKTPIYAGGLELVGTTGMARDITSRKTIENILLESEEKFRQFAENTADSFILCSSESVLYVNPAFQKIFGHNLQEAYGFIHIPSDWVHPEDRSRIIGYFNSKEYKKTGKFNGQYRIIKEDGTVSWVWERNFPVFNKNGKIIRFFSVTSDITLQKQLEVDLIKTKAQQQAILDNIPHMAWLKDIEGKYVSVNEAFAKYYNHSKEELIGKTDSDFCHPDLAELFAYNDYIVLNTKKQQQFDEFVDTPEGTVYTETIKTPVINIEGEVIGIAGISRDITYYKRIEQQLRSNDDRLKALLQNSTDNITVIDDEGIILFDSSLSTKISGLTTQQDIIGRSFSDFVYEPDRNIVDKIIKQAVANQEGQYKAEYRFQKPDGSILYFESFFTNHLKNNLIKGIVINSRDISERKASEIKEKDYQKNLVFLENTALEFLSTSSSEQIYNYIGKKIHELVPESVVIFSSYDENEDCLIIQNLTGVDKFIGIINDFLGQSPLNYRAHLTEQMKRELHLTSNKLHLLNGGLYNVCNRQIDYMVCKALEKLISLKSIYGMGIVRSDKLLGSIVIFTRYEFDIKDPGVIETFLYQASIALLRLRVENELISSKEKAEESDKLKTAFLANMSHEIRTPVNGIIGFSQLLEDDTLTEEKRREFIEIIKANADALISLIDDILDVSIIQEGQVKLRKTTTNINLLLDEVFTNYSSLRYKSKNISLEIHKALPDESATLMTDPLRIKQILNNLLSNAFKFTEKGKIEFGYFVEKEYFKFFVKDSGIGISPEKQENIFKRFIQGEATFNRRYGGSGLGLAISKGLVELMGGKIGVISSIGEGSEFYFTIPNSENSLKNPESLIESAKSNPSLLN